MTPLFQHVERVRETCARLSLENAATTAACGKTRKDNNDLREEICEMQTRLQEAEALRERDVYHLKAADDLLAEKLGQSRNELMMAIDQCSAASAKATADAVASGADSLQQLQSAFDLRFDAAASEQSRLRAAESEQLMGALAALERRTDLARQELRDALSGKCATLRDNMTERFDETASTFEAMQAEHRALAERSEAQPPALRLEIATAVESATRALEAKIVQLQSSLVRVDQKAKQQAAALEDSKEEALSKLEEAQEARAELEARVSTLEFRLEALERTAAREEERRRQELAVNS